MPEDGLEDPPAAATMPAVVRTYEEEQAYLTRLDPTCYAIAPGFVPGMRVPGVFYVNARLSSLMFDELQQYIEAGGVGGFIPAMKQIGNVAALPGIVGV
jgi:tRNA-splicing ligase RtcB (3'-phosphate/5'-hydroxy nucleic acid ligase)